MYRESVKVCIARFCLYMAKVFFVALPSFCLPVNMSQKYKMELKKLKLLLKNIAEINTGLSHL